MRVDFSKEARAEADDAATWYSKIDEKLGVRFETEIERAIEHIEIGPERWQSHKHGTRRILLKHFPYALIYQVLSDVIVVHAVTHQHRRPTYWRSRLR